MTHPSHVLAIDQGTTSTRSIVFDVNACPVASAQAELNQHYSDGGWVEHDPEDIWRDVVATARDAIGRSGVGPEGIASIGITNQRETVVVWERATGKPIHRAIVWQDRRTAETCARLRADGVEPMVRAKTGLLLDPYFSATKLAWILDTIPGARTQAERGLLACGTIDSFILWRLTGGKVHATDITNASRTLLYDIRDQRWCEELCRLFRVPRQILPDVEDTSFVYGSATADLFGRAIPVASLVGDQQAALFGQACIEPGMAKSTYGTGCFLLLNTGEEIVASTHSLLATPAYRLKGRTTYAVEGSIFVAGAAIQWLRDGLGIIANAAETSDLARQVPDHHGVYLVPAFVGLGAPHWDPDARGSIFGLTFGATALHLVRAALESVAYQTADLLQAMAAGGGISAATLRVDGGMAANDWLCQFLADVLGASVERPMQLETTALGAAFHAGLATAVWPDLPAVAHTWALRDSFQPKMAAEQRQQLIAGWRDAVSKTLSKAPQ